MVSGDREASILRTGFTGATTAHLVVDDGAYLGGASLTLDSSYDTDLSERATLAASALSLNSGRVSVLLNNPGLSSPMPTRASFSAAVSSLVSPIPIL